MSYLTREIASHVAFGSGAPFMTFYDRQVQAWYIRSVDLALPAEANDWSKREGVHHVEWALINSNLTPCIVTYCHPATFAEMWDVPEGWVVEPLDASKWATPAQQYQRPKSEVASPVKVVWALASTMIGASRAEVIAACIAAGVNKSTAATQYYKWGKANA